MHLAGILLNISDMESNRLKGRRMIAKNLKRLHRWPKPTMGAQCMLFELLRLVKPESALRFQVSGK